MKTGANDGEENSLRSSAVKTLSLRGEGRPLSPVASSGPNYGGGDEGRSSNYLRSREEMAPKKMCANDGEEKSPRSSGVKKLSPRGGGPPAEPGGLIGAKIMAAAMVAAQRNPAQRQGTGAHEKRAQRPERRTHRAAVW